MNAMAFDTHKHVKALKEAGAAEALAEALVATVGAVAGENLATKAGLAEVKADIVELKADVRALKSDVVALKSDMTALKSDMTALKSDMTALQSDMTALQSDMTALKAKVARMPDMEALRAEFASKSDLAALESRINQQMAERFAALYRQLWVMAASVVGLTVTLSKLIS